MNDHDRKVRAIWKLEQGGYRVQREGSRCIMTNVESVTELGTLLGLVAFAEAVYKRVWTGRNITPST
jgi:hypothetical protein